MQIVVIGAGLAGCEAAWRAARRGVDATLVEMKPRLRPRERCARPAARALDALRPFLASALEAA